MAAADHARSGLTVLLDGRLELLVFVDVLDCGVLILSSLGTFSTDVDLSETSSELGSGVLDFLFHVLNQFLANNYVITIALKIQIYMV